MASRQESVEALTFLQNQVASVVDHDDTDESAVFRSLLLHLLAPAAPEESGTDQSSKGDPANTSSVTSNLPLSLCAVQDPVEQELDPKRSPPSGLHYTQRMEVFDALLEFAAKKDKQPCQDLVELVECAARDAFS